MISAAGPRSVTGSVASAPLPMVSRGPPVAACAATSCDSACLSGPRWADTGNDMAPQLSWASSCEQTQVIRRQYKKSEGNTPLQRMLTVRGAKKTRRIAVTQAHLVMLCALRCRHLHISGARRSLVTKPRTRWLRSRRADHGPASCCCRRDLRVLVIATAVSCLLVHRGPADAVQDMQHHSGKFFASLLWSRDWSGGYSMRRSTEDALRFPNQEPVRQG